MQSCFWPQNVPRRSSSWIVEKNAQYHRCTHYPSAKSWCPVILTANVSRRLVNGLGWRVMSLEEDHGTIYLQDLIELHQIHQHNFFSFNPKTKSHMFILKQISLILAYGITIHKNQRMTMHSVSVYCSGCFAAGQIAVSISRVTSSEQLSCPCTVLTPACVCHTILMWTVIVVRHPLRYWTRHSAVKMNASALPLLSKKLKWAKRVKATGMLMTMMLVRIV